MDNKVYQVVLRDESFDNLYVYESIHRTFDGAERYIVEELGYHKVYAYDCGEVHTWFKDSNCQELRVWYLESDKFVDKETYRFHEIYNEPQAFIEEYELME